jgi:hypothetical protein
MTEAAPDAGDALPSRGVAALRALGLGGLAAALLESGGPLPFLGAQWLYAAAPLLSPLAGDETLAAWARRLEDPQQARRLAAQLREGGPAQSREGGPAQRREGGPAQRRKGE